MSIYALSDLHLSFGVKDKPMNIFGDKWNNYEEKLKENNCYVASLCSIKNKKLMLYSHDYIHFDVGNYEYYHDISTLFAVEYISDILYLNMLTRSTKK